ncbi:MAG: L-2-amino-thiazoline-4-carboxylic acid hydrolase, partial [Chloroflexota bacterium]
PSLLREFDKSIMRVRPTLVARFGEEQADMIIRESGREYEKLVPEIPYIGERSPMLYFLMPTGRYLAVYRTLQRHGRTLEEAGQVVYEMGEAAIKAVPAVARQAIGYLWHSSLFQRRLRKRATESRARKYPGGYVMDFVEGDGQEFDYGVDYIECASCKFLKAQDALELAPYGCAVDKPASELMGWGLSRTMTLAEGYDRCDFRFKKGAKTCVPLPPSLAKSAG